MIHGTQKHRLLLVDDNRDVADMLAVLLRRAGHDVETAYDGPAAVEAARTKRPDVILLDISLPGMDGYQVAREICKQPEFGDTWLVAISGYGQEEDVRQAHEAGFRRHLLKPVRLEAIQDILDDRDRANGHSAH